MPKSHPSQLPRGITASQGNAGGGIYPGDQGENRVEIRGGGGRRSAGSQEMILEKGSLGLTRSDEIDLGVMDPNHGGINKTVEFGVYGTTR
jgi:hypothetical protein